jgi:hypothetical protein
MKLIALAALSSLTLASTGALADNGDRSFLLCEGTSQKDSDQSFAFTVTLDIGNEKVISIGSGDGAVTEAFTDTEIVGKQNLGGGVVNWLTVDRATRTFSLAVVRTKATTSSAGDPVTDDEFRGACRPTGKAF